MALANLVDFLKVHRWNTDARIESVRWDAENGLELMIEAYPFWFPQMSREGSERGRLRLSIRGIEQTSIDLSWDPSEVDVLCVGEDEPLLWSKLSVATILCNTPIYDPGGFLFEYLLVCEELGLAGPALEFLNADSGLAKWCEIVGQSSYSLLRGPSEIIEPVKKLLTARGVEFSVVGEWAAKRDTLKVVWINSSWIICSEAMVEFEVRDGTVPPTVYG